MSTRMRLKSPDNMGRRDFLRVGAGSALVASAAFHGARVLGANNRVRIGVVGIRGMGQGHIQAFSALPGVEVAALCDIDENLFPEIVQKRFVDKGLPKPRLCHDLRKLYDDKEIDAVTVVTPNHWHALAAIWAMQAGKHVTVEKPVCHNYFEGKKLVEAWKKYRVIVQDGAEQRSNPCAQTAAQFLHSGQLGEVYMAKGLCYKWRETIGHFEDEPVPAGVHYDLWLGPARKRPFNRNRFHYNWHWSWDYGNGDMGNQGVHEMDVARWGLGVTLPTKISAVGGHLLFNDDQQTPNMLLAMFEFDNSDGAAAKKKVLQFEVRGWMTNREGGLGEWDRRQAATDYMTSDVNTIGNIFFGSKGYMVKDVNQWRTYLGQEREPGPTGKGLANHYQNFIDAIRANDQSIINGSIQEGHYSAALIHFANISYRLGRTLYFDKDRECFTGDDEATRLLTREYRAPFVVTERV